MKLSRSIYYIAFILVIQYIFIIAIPYMLFHLYLSVVFVDWSVFIDQLIKAVISALFVGVWLYQWMWVTNRLYKYLRRGGA